VLELGVFCILSNNAIQNGLGSHVVKTRLQKALDNLERVIENKIQSTKKVNEPNLDLLAVKREINELREKNIIASNRLDGTIDQIKKILGN